MLTRSSCRSVSRLLLHCTLNYLVYSVLSSVERITDDYVVAYCIVDRTSLFRSLYWILACGKRNKRFEVLIMAAPLAVALSVGLAVVASLVLAVVLLVVAIRWRRRLQQSNSPAAATAQPEMEWDNSAFNITVNPIGVENCADYEDIELGGRVTMVADDVDDDDEAATASELDEADDQATKCKMAAATKDLEWDDSTLSY